MRVSEVHVYQKDLPIVGGPYTMSTMTLHNVDTTIVRLVTDSGIVGWGEVAPIGPLYQPQHALGARAAIAEMAPNIIGQSCLTPLLFCRRMNGLLNGHLYAKAALEVAVMDALGKHFGVRVCDLLGGAVDPAQSPYAYGGVAGHLLPVALAVAYDKDEQVTNAYETLEALLARLRSIERRAQEEGLVLPGPDAVPFERLESPQEAELTKLVGRFPDLIQHAAAARASPVHVVSTSPWNG